MIKSCPMFRPKKEEDKVCCCSGWVDKKYVKIDYLLVVIIYYTNAECQVLDLLSLINSRITLQK